MNFKIIFWFIAFREVCGKMKILPQNFPKPCSLPTLNFDECESNFLKKAGNILLQGVKELNFPNLQPLVIPKINLYVRFGGVTVSVLAINTSSSGFESVTLRNFTVMEMAEEEEKEPSGYMVALLYAVLSFVCVILFVLIIFVACSRKYRLNWFEKNLLESASNNKDLEHSQETLVHEFMPGSSKSLCTNNSGEEKFWVPQNVKKMSSCQSDNDSSPDESVPASPTSSISYQLVPGPLPIAGNEKHVVLTNTSPVRPKLASMQSKLDHTKIDTSLYQAESPVETEDVRGSIHVTLTYDPIAEILTVRLVEAQDLQARDFSGTADPYAKIRLLPDKTNVWQTRIHKKTLNPVFDEDFVFEVRAATLGRHTLEILLYDFDAFSRHHRIGYIQMALANVDLSEKVDAWKGLTPCSGHDAHLDLGELMVSLAYLPSAERLTVVVIKARNLRMVDDTRNSSDPYVKVSINQGSKRLKKRKTGVHRNTVNPVFNEALTFDIGKNTLRKCVIEFCVMHDSLLGASELLGKARVGQTPECKRHEKEFFADMFHSKTATAQWLPLSDSKPAPTNTN